MYVCLYVCFRVKERLIFLKGKNHTIRKYFFHILFILSVVCCLTDYQSPFTNHVWIISSGKFFLY